MPVTRASAKSAASGPNRRRMKASTDSSSAPGPRRRNRSKRSDSFLRCLLDHHVGVRTYEPEGTYAGNASLLAARPWREAGWNESMTSSQRDTWIDLLQMEMRRNLFVLKRENHLDQSSHARC